jgi:sugar (pentulose or hexulose) kinase
VENILSAVLGIDLGTTTITAVALDPGNGQILASAAAPNRAETTSVGNRSRGYSEWDVEAIFSAAGDCLREVMRLLGTPASELAGLGITGQQHGGVLVGPHLRLLTPLIGWQDRRAEEELFAARTFVRQALDLAGPEATARTGCRMAAGYLAVTLFWLKEKGLLPRAAKACFLMDCFAARLTGQPPVTDPTCAASSGALNLRTLDWDADLLSALALPRSALPEVRRSGELQGRLTADSAAATGLPQALPVFVGIGDNQASFLGSVAEIENSVLVNVGTGGQVAAWDEDVHFDPLLETRPFPGGGFLLVCAGLCGGRSYDALESFFRQVGAQFFGAQDGRPLFDVMNQLAAATVPGAGGVGCEPFFTGTRHRPELRASWVGLSLETFTPAHLTRALLEGMARAFRSGYDAITGQTGRRAQSLVGAGNGLRENPLLADIVAGAMELPLLFPRHRAEAAFGAALVAAVGCGACPNLASAGQLIGYQQACS